MDITLKGVRMNTRARIKREADPLSYHRSQLRYTAKPQKKHRSGIIEPSVV
jgi:hypothetical protein